MRPELRTFTCLSLLLLLTTEATVASAATWPPRIRPTGIVITRPIRVNMPLRFHSAVLVTHVTPEAAERSVEVDIGGSGAVTLRPDGEVRDASTVGPALSEAVAASVEVELRNGEILAFDGTIGPDGAAQWVPEDPTNSTLSVETVVVDTVAGSTSIGLDFRGDGLDEILQADLVLAVPYGEPECVVPSRLGCLGWGPRPVEIRRHIMDLGDTFLRMVSPVAYDPDVRQTADVVVRGRRGQMLESFEAELWRPWDDGAGGQLAAAVDGDHPMQLSFVRSANGGTQLAVLSEGWSRGGPLPAEIIVDLGDGGVVSAAPTMFDIEGVVSGLDVPAGATIERDIDRGPWTGTDVGAGEGYLCDGDGLCVLIVDGETGPQVAMTAFAADLAELPDSMSVPLLVHTADGGTEATSVDVSFPDDVTVVALFDIDLGADPTADIWAARVTVRGEASGAAEQGPVLVAPRTVHFVTDSYAGGHVRMGLRDGVSTLGTAPPGVVLGQGVELDPERGPSEPYPVPVIVYLNGSGTKNASSQTSTRPQLL